MVVTEVRERREVFILRGGGLMRGVVAVLVEVEVDEEEEEDERVKGGLGLGLGDGDDGEEWRGEVLKVESLPKDSLLPTLPAGLGIATSGILSTDVSLRRNERERFSFREGKILARGWKMGGMRRRWDGWEDIACC